ncbi:head GIN domain-containing protein [uncultured Bacteroides sp.]|uniref:head GIN domain-containing protein n=1 Tax=uncultured Bacteroides sp. TaxID=162156 RepID=UPI002AAB6061|nr:head GIN domain-containing protein [uncultured Bacteroides sp.]
MKLFSYSTLLVFTLLSLSSCMQAKRVAGSGKIVKKEVKINSSFNTLKLLGSPDVIYKQIEGTPKIEISCSDNLVDLLDIKVKNGALLVKFKSGLNIFNRGKVEVRVYAPALEAFSIQGSGDISLINGIKTDKNLAFSIQGSGDITGKSIVCSGLKLSVIGSGDMDLNDLQVNHTSANITGSGDIALSGKSKKSDFKVTGSGDISAVKLLSDKVHVGISGSGDVSCYATEFLSGSVSGSGSVGYKGSPSIHFSRKGLYKL